MALFQKECVSSAFDLSFDQSGSSDTLYSAVLEFSGNFQAQLVDPLLNLNWAIDHVGAPEAWKFGSGEGMVVAVLDTGTDLDHPDLAQNLWRNRGEIPGDQIDNDGNGFVDDVFGWNFSTSGPGSDVQDHNNHGTHVAGLIAAVEGNGEGISGIAPDAEIMTVKVLSDNARGSYSSVAAGIDYAIEMGANVINMSLSGPSATADVVAALERAQEAGIIIVAAAGNQSQDSAAYPAAYTSEFDNIISVASIDKWNVISSFSNFSFDGRTVDVAAPGESLLSTLANGNYGPMSGTSMAAPVVAACVAVVWSANPDLSYLEVIKAIEGSVVPLPYVGRPIGTNGFVDLAAAVSFYDDGNFVDLPPPPPVEPVYTRGGNGSETLMGTSVNDTLIGGDGDDTLAGLEGDDLILGDGGSDFIEAGSGMDSCWGGDGDDIIFGEEGHDEIGGGVGNDTIDSGLGNDTAWGGAGDDSIEGGEGDDVIGGGDGQDSLYGGDGLDQVFGGIGNDLIVGGRDSDTLYGGAGSDRISEGDGDGLIGGGAGADYISAGSGNDTVWGGHDNDTIEGGVGNDWLSGGLGNDTVDGEEGDDLIFGRGGDDLLRGGEGVDRLDGGAGRDTLQGGFGDDWLRGGQDADTFVFAASDDSHSGGSDTIEDFSFGEGDVIAFTGITLWDETYVISLMREDGSDVMLDYGAGLLRFEGLSIVDFQVGDGWLA